jgi:cyclic pyranopterin phosphate synthase
MSINAKMVDISRKEVVRREAIAEGRIILRPSTIDLLRKGLTEKGDAIQIASLAGISAAKMTSHIMLLCHPLPLEKVEVNCEIFEKGVAARSRVVAMAKTGVEMEALTAVTAALLNIWDVVKQYEKDETGNYPSTLIEEIRVVRKIKSKLPSE